MRSFCAFVYHGLEEASQNYLQDGKDLASGCLAKLIEEKDPEQFPPRLFILLASPNYGENGRAAHLISGVHQILTAQGLGGVPLIGSSASAIVFDRRVHERGAVLFCLASRFITVAAAAASPDAQSPEDSIVGLVKELDPKIGQGDDPNPHGNRTLLVFLPSPQPGCPPSRLHRLLGSATLFRIPMAGGVSAATGPERQLPGFQFFGFSSLKGTPVAALIESDCPIAYSLASGYLRTEEYVHVKDEATREITDFREGPAAQFFSNDTRIALLGETSHDRVHVTGVLTGLWDGRTLHLPREVPSGQRLEILKPDAAEIGTSYRSLVDHALRRIHTDNPIAGLVFRCTSHYRYRDRTGMDIERDLRDFEEFKRVPLVGGLFDGEIGVDETGWMVCTNWSWSSLAFGDELTDAAVRRHAFTALAEFTPKLSATKDLREAAELSVKMIRGAGYPGAMLSLVLDQDQDQWVVAQAASGPRFPSILDDTVRKLTDKDILPVVISRGESHFIPDSRKDSRCDLAAVRKSGIVSQYVRPLLDKDRKPFGAIQIDLGDSSHLRQIRRVPHDVMGLLISDIAAFVEGVMAADGARIVSQLDRSLQRGLGASSPEEGLQRFLQSAVKAFRADRGHVRKLMPETNQLELIAGVGDYYEVARKSGRKAIDATDSGRSGRAFSREDLTTINNVAKDDASVGLSARHSDEPALVAALGRARSCATAVFFSAKSERAGTITLHALRSWFFHRHHVACLKILAQRAGFLVEHLERKQEAEGALRRFRFRLDAVARLDAQSEVEDASAAFTQIAARLRAAADARTASLYLWQKAVERFVLIAQSGWNDERWVGAARFARGQDWHGSAAADSQPRYFPDLERHCKEARLGFSERIREAMFGPVDSAVMRIEAISIPLRIGAEHLGLLTLHRIARAANPLARFAAINLEDLREAGCDLANLVAVLRAVQAARQEARAIQLRSQIYEDFVNAAMQNGASLPQDVLLKSIIVQLQAGDVSFFFDESGGQGGQADGLRCVAATSSDLPAPDPEAQQVFRTGVPFHKRKELGQGSGPLDPIDAATEGCMQRVCIPVRDRLRIRGVLDIRWTQTRDYLHCPINLAVLEQLEILGEEIGVDYAFYLERRKRESQVRSEQKTDLALRAGAAMVLQYAHRLTNLLTDVRNAADHLETIGKHDSEMRELGAFLRQGTELVERPLLVARRIHEGSSGSVDLRSLIGPLLDRLDSIRPQDCTVSLDMPAGLVALIDPESTGEVFRNIIENAFSAVRKKKEAGVLTIVGRPDDATGQVSVTFSDTGVGMTSDETQAARAGFFSTRGSKGVGLLISDVLVAAQGGKLAIESRKGGGTEVRVTLPGAEQQP